ncbi:Leu/Phe/Val dehydrogenase [Sphingomonas sp.]|uniref:Leu/Phe/Val dehydrogenase n=1 Tax=Sphingomonas sp. TaxID=28214 RepID=UPI003B3B39F3
MTRLRHFAGSPPERVVVLDDARARLKGVVVLHSSRLGPAAGGCRFWRYPNMAALHFDALRLAEGMSYKNALAGLPLGGGKAVLALPDGPFDRTRLFEAVGRAVADLGGNYVMAEGVGTTIADMSAVRRTTDHVAGLPAMPGRAGGDPSPWTARGVFRAMEVAAHYRFGCKLEGLTVAVQGLGNVGTHLCALLHRAGVRLILAEPRPGVADALAARYDAAILPPDQIVGARADIFAPCALGGILDTSAIAALRAKLVCGAANNVLATPEDGDRLADRGILYAPDYVVNAGGIINVAAEYLGWDLAEVERRVEATGTRLERVLASAWDEGVAPSRAADQMARRMIRDSPVRAGRSLLWA